MKRIARSAIVAHSAAQLFALVEQIEAYPQFLPWCQDARVLERTPGRTVATLKVGLRGLRYEFTTENTNQPPASIDMRLVKGPFRHFAAHWRFVPLGERGARISFAMEYQFAGPVVSRVLAPVFNLIADTMVDAFKQRADAVHGQDTR
jgi:ribosome-associated toxin RatA of RatAB toxin-antitoxin module